jgi:hypothetical protein
MTALAFAISALLAVPSPLTDAWDLYTNSVLGRVPTAEGVTQLDKISVQDLFKAKPVLPGADGGFVVVRTDEGNWAKLIVRGAIRKQGESEHPIVVIQRYHTLRSDTERGRLAAGKGVYLFDGFRFDLDIGQVVPADQGGDIEFHREGPGGGYLHACAKAKLYLVGQALIPSTAADPAAPSRGPVLATDFAGHYQLVANGQWSGRLTLEVARGGEVSGSYVSDQTGRDYSVKGFVATPAHRIRFTIELPMVKQEFDGYLWTHGKAALAGVTTLSERPFGFVAVREGTELIRAADE